MMTDRRQSEHCSSATRLRYVERVIGKITRLAQSTSGARLRAQRKTVAITTTAPDGERQSRKEEGRLVGHGQVASRHIALAATATQAIVARRINARQPNVNTWSTHEPPVQSQVIMVPSPTSNTTLVDYRPMSCPHRRCAVSKTRSSAVAERPRCRVHYSFRQK